MQVWLLQIIIIKNHSFQTAPWIQIQYTAFLAHWSKREKATHYDILFNGADDLSK